MSILLFIAFMLIGSFWGLHCNNKTYNQRISILNDIHKNYLDRMWQQIETGEHVIFTDPWKELTSVDYNTHLWYLVTFRDPYALYPEYCKMMDEKENMQ